MTSTPPQAETQGGERGPSGSRGLATWVRLLDDAIRIPGTEMRIGLDPIIGLLFPGVGDWLTGTSGVAVLIQALRAGVPTIVLGRMVLNLAIDTLLGMVPVLGDVFDAFFKAHRRNLNLVESHGRSGKPAALVDYVLVAGAAIICVVGALTPFWLIPLLLEWLSRLVQ